MDGRRCLESRVNQLLSEGKGESDEGIGKPPLSKPGVVSSVISRVPSTMHKVHPEAYEPQLVSIGPLHMWDEALQPMLKHKLRFYLRLSDRLYGERTLNNDLRVKADQLVGQAKQCYFDTNLDVEDQDFSLMLALDGCFILELFRYDLKNKKGTLVIDEPILETRWMLPALRLDLIKIGNQLPFFVLEQLYNLTRSSTDEPSLLQLAASFLSPLFPGEVPNRQLKDGHAHLLALFHSIFVPPISSHHTSLPISDSNTKELPHDKGSSIGSVTELRHYGIRLKKGKGDLIDIKFQPNGVIKILEIPSLGIHHNTISIFLNLVAYEQSNKIVPSYLTSYISFFDDLVNSPEDVMILRQSGIINHSLGSDEQVAEQINCLLRKVAYDGRHNYLSKPILEINIHKRKPFSKWKAELIRNYFSTPDKSITMILGLYGLYMAVIQTLFSALSYYQPKSKS